MAKYDTSKITDFDKMDADALRNLISGIDIPDDKSDEFAKLQAEYQKVKSSFDKTASELADAKKREKASMTAEEAAKAERDNEMRELTEKYEALLKENTLSKHKASFVAFGLDEKAAEETAAALADGDYEKLFSNLGKYKSDFEKSIRADVIKSTPKPSDAGGSEKYKTKDDILKITDARKRQEAIAANPELFGIT